MRLRDVIIWFVCIILAVVLLITAGAQLDFINSQRQDMKLISNAGKRTLDEIEKVLIYHFREQLGREPKMAKYFGSP